MSVMPRSPTRSRFSVAIVFVLVLLRLRPIGVGVRRNVSRNVIRNARNALTGRNLVIRNRRRELLERIAAWETGSRRRTRGSRRSRGRAEKLNRMFEAEVHVFEYRLLSRDTDQ